MEAQELASRIVKKLVDQGYLAFYAGGWVRDFVLGHPSSDIDIATSAPPDVVLTLFPKTLSIGISFGIVVVVENGHQFEVATFRKDLDYRDGRRPSRVEYADAEEDAKRRDFTINGMFFDPIEERIIDFVGGKEDIRKGIIRTIGDPYERFSEDRLRMIRAVRFAARFGFHVDPATQEAIQQYADMLFPAVAKERVWQELNKISQNPNVESAFIELHRLKLLQQIFPFLKEVHLDDIKKRVYRFNHFPHKCPAVFFIMELFPDSPLEELIAIFLDLKASNREIKLVEFAYSAKSLLTKDNDELVAWAYFYAHPFAETLIDIYDFQFREKHKERKAFLMPHIARIVQKCPLVSSSHLKERGIKPGEEMGILLAKAERIAIQYNLEDPKEVLKRLGL